MPIAEFDLIERYFAGYKPTNAVTELGIGDDCALMQIPDGYHLAVTTDTMVEGIHFFADVDPEFLGYKLLAVNLSDLASMGAEPVAVTLALTMPRVDENWLLRFSKGFLQLAQQFGVDLIGGDTTSGPLALTVQALGIVPKTKAMKRSCAKVGDLVCVTGKLGDAGLGLKIKQGYISSDPEGALNRFNTPQPRVSEGMSIRELANACIDLSDGLVSDLGHILEQSRVGACVDWEKIPLSEPVKEYIGRTGDWKMPIATGDDYELCFTVPPENLDKLKVPFTRIGIIEQEEGLRFRKDDNVEVLKVKGFEHFS